MNKKKLKDLKMKKKKNKNLQPTITEVNKEKIKH